MAVTRNQDRARRRHLQACSLASSPELEVWENGKILLEPSDDEDPRMKIPGTPWPLPSYFAPPLGSSDPRPTEQVNPSTAPSPSTKRPGGPLETSSNKEKRTPKHKMEHDLEANLADFGLPSENDDHIRMVVTDEGRVNAIEHPTFGPTGYGRL